MSTNLERQITVIEAKIKNGKTKNVFAAKNKVINLKHELAAKNRARYWMDWIGR